MKSENHFRDGPALAAIFSGALGVLILGILTVLAAASNTIKDSLNLYPPAGPLSGKTGIAVVMWLISWGCLHLLWRKRDVPFKRVWHLSLLLILLGFLFTFPPFFELFHAQP